MISTKNKDLYAIAGQEVTNGSIDTGLWAKAFAESRGDEQQAKALYLKLRVADLEEQRYELERKLKQEARLEREEESRRKREDAEAERENLRRSTSAVWKPSSSAEKPAYSITQGVMLFVLLAAVFGGFPFVAWLISR